MHINEKRTRIRRLASSIYPLFTVFFWCLIIFGFSDPCSALLTLTAALFHECGHVTYLYIKRDTLTLPRGRLLGFGLKGFSWLSYAEEAAYYAAGPAANLLGAAAGALCIPALGEYGALITLINLATAIANLLPIEGHDGYGILRAALAWRGADERYLASISLFFSALLCLISLYTIDRVGEGYFIFVVLLLSMLGSIEKRLSHTKSEFY